MPGFASSTRSAVTGALGARVSARVDVGTCCGALRCFQRARELIGRLEGFASSRGGHEDAQRGHPLLGLPNKPAVPK